MLYVPGILPKAKMVGDAEKLQQEFQKAEGEIYDIDPMQITDNTLAGDIFIKPSDGFHGITITHDPVGVLLAQRNVNLLLPVPVVNSQRYTLPLTGSVGAVGGTSAPLEVAFELFADTWINVIGSIQVGCTALTAFSVDLVAAINGTIIGNQGTGAGPGLNPNPTRFSVLTQGHVLLPPGIYTATLLCRERRDGTTGASPQTAITQADLMVYGFSR